MPGLLSTRMPFTNFNGLIVRADTPGVRPDDVEIDVQDGVLTIEPVTITPAAG